MYNTGHLGRIIRLQRLNKKLTLEKAAEMCHLSVKGLQKIELGDSDPKWSNVVKIARNLGIDLGDLSVCVSIVEAKTSFFCK